MSPKPGERQERLTWLSRQYMDGKGHSELWEAWKEKYGGSERSFQRALQTVEERHQTGGLSMRRRTQTLCRLRFDDIYAEARRTHAPALCPKCQEAIKCSTCGTGAIVLKPQLGRAESVTWKLVQLYKLEVNQAELMEDEDVRRETVAAFEQEAGRFSPEELRRVIAAAQASIDSRA